MKIKVSEPEFLFDNHFSNNSNKRILFSGKFGSGKTYFLKDFFDKKKDIINTFWLSPVKYSVSQNEDIFEYIKFDLALKLISMPEFAASVKTKFSEDQYLYQFLSNQPLISVEALFILLEDLSEGDSAEKKVISLVKESKKVLEKLMLSYKKYKEFKGKIDESLKTHTDIFKNYLIQSSLSKGSIFEDDLITQTIRTALEICEFQSKKDNILIIDDFDRLDPEHVFRILNILSVHNEMYDDANKFGFNKIIIVCDYENISSIYSHKYGGNINFSGYISKFFSTDVFHFSNKLAIQHYCKTQLSNVVGDQNAQDVLGLLLSYFVEKDKLTIRDIVKVKIPHKSKPFKFGPYEIWKTPDKYKGYHSRTFKYSPFVSSETNDFFISSDDYPFLPAIKTMSIIFGGYSNLRAAISNIDYKKSDTFEKIYIDKIIKSMFTLINHARNSDKSYLFFSFTGDNQGFNFYLDAPAVDIYNLRIDVPTGWDGQNSYKGDSSYYINVNNNINKKDFTKERDVEFGSYQQIIKDLSLVLGF